VWPHESKCFPLWSWSRISICRCLGTPGLPTEPAGFSHNPFWLSHLSTAGKSLTSWWKDQKTRLSRSHADVGSSGDQQSWEEAKGKCFPVVRPFGGWKSVQEPTGPLPLTGISRQWSQEIEACDDRPTRSLMRDSHYRFRAQISPLREDHGSSVSVLDNAWSGFWQQCAEHKESNRRNLILADFERIVDDVVKDSLPNFHQQGKGGPFHFSLIRSQIECPFQKVFPTTFLRHSHLHRFTFGAIALIPKNTDAGCRGRTVPTRYRMKTITNTAPTKAAMCSPRPGPDLSRDGRLHSRQPTMPRATITRGRGSPRLRRFAESRHTPYWYVSRALAECWSLIWPCMADGTCKRIQGHMPWINPIVLQGCTWLHIHSPSSRSEQATPVPFHYWSLKRPRGQWRGEVVPRCSRWWARKSGGEDDRWFRMEEGGGMAVDFFWRPGGTKYRDGTNNHAVCVCGYHTPYSPTGAAPSVLYMLLRILTGTVLATDQGGTGATRWLRRQCKRYHNIAQHTLAEPFSRLYRPHYRVSRSVAVIHHPSASFLQRVMPRARLGCHVTRIPSGAVSTEGEGRKPNWASVVRWPNSHAGLLWELGPVKVKPRMPSWMRTMWKSPVRGGALASRVPLP
jgi:hypothetical protein